MAGLRRPRARLSRTGAGPPPAPRASNSPLAAEPALEAGHRRRRRLLRACASRWSPGLVVYAALTLPDINTIGKTTGTIKILDVHGTLIAEVGHDSDQPRTT